MPTEARLVTTRDREFAMSRAFAANERPVAVNLASLLASDSSPSSGASPHLRDDSSASAVRRAMLCGVTEMSIVARQKYVIR